MTISALPLSGRSFRFPVLVHHSPLAIDTNNIKQPLEPRQEEELDFAPLGERPSVKSAQVRQANPYYNTKLSDRAQLQSH